MSKVQKMKKTFKWEHSGREVFIVVGGSATFNSQANLGGMLDSAYGHSSDQTEVQTKFKMSPVYSVSQENRNSTRTTSSHNANPRALYFIKDIVSGFIIISVINLAESICGGSNQLIGIQIITYSCGILNKSCSYRNYSAVRSTTTIS